MYTIDAMLGVGIYTPAEAAFYARVSPRLMTRWVFGNASGEPVIERQIQATDEKVVTFLDFVQMLAVREVRQRHHLPLQRIRQGIERAKSEYGLDYPLAHKHRIYLFSDQQGSGHGEMLIRLDDDGDEAFVQLTGRDHGNMMLKPVVELFLDDLSFDPETGLATRYRPLVHNGVSVVLDPHRRFGEPIIEPGGYTADMLWQATNIEGGIGEAAEAYGVSVDEIVIANRYYDSLSLKLM